MAAATADTSAAMAKGGSLRLWVELAAVVAAAGAYWYFRPPVPQPAEAASPIAPLLIGTGPSIVLHIEIYDVPFFGETDEELARVIGPGTEGRVRVVTADKMGELRGGLRQLMESGQIAVRPGGRTNLRPGQTASVKVMGRAMRASGSAREELSLGMVGTWVDASGALQLDTWFRKEKVEGILTTQAEGQAVGGRSSILPGEAVVLSQVLEGTRYIVVLRLDKPIGR